MKTLLFIILLALFLSSVLLDKAVHALPSKELRRRARSKEDTQTNKIYKLAAHGESLKLTLWLVGGVSGAGLALILAGISWVWAVLFILLAAGIILIDKPLAPHGRLWQVASMLSGPLASVLVFLQPVLLRIAKIIKKLQPIHLHTGLYDKEDLLELLNHQDQQADNRIAEEDLKIAFGALTFGDKTVGSVMTPRRMVKLVAATDSIGPLLMDDLHKSGFSRFPVIKEPTKAANPQIVGTLYLKDLIGHEGMGKVKDVMKKDVFFINESQTLRQALNEFLKTQHHLLIVVNDFEEISGVISLEDVMEQILGGKIVDESTQPEDVRAEAELDAKKEHDKHSDPEVVK